MLRFMDKRNGGLSDAAIAARRKGGLRSVEIQGCDVVAARARAGKAAKYTPEEIREQCRRAAAKSAEARRRRRPRDQPRDPALKRLHGLVTAVAEGILEWDSAIEYALRATAEADRLEVAIARLDSERTVYWAEGGPDCWCPHAFEGPCIGGGFTEPGGDAWHCFLGA